MLIVTGKVRVRPEEIGAALTLSLEHVHRSRLEPGCILHTVHQDVEDPDSVVFIEHWADRDALTAHFRVPASGEFVTAMTRLSTEPPSIEIYDVERVKL